VTRPVLYASGISTGLTGESFFRLLAQVNWVNVITFAGNVIVTAIACYAAWRATLREQARLDAEAVRLRRIEDAQAEAKLRELMAQAQAHVMPGKDLAQLHSEGS
jgi:hypothetical protein